MSVLRSVDPVRKARSRVALASRYGTRAEVTEARRELTAGKLERAIREALAANPGIAPKRRDELAKLLVGGAE